jgi:hypothetical protein
MIPSVQSCASYQYSISILVDQLARPWQQPKSNGLARLGNGDDL